MYDTLKNDEFLALYNQAKADRLAGVKITKWTSGDTSVEQGLTLDWAGANGNQVWAGLAAEFRLRFPEKVGRARRRCSAARFVG